MTLASDSVLEELHERRAKAKLPPTFNQGELYYLPDFIRTLQADQTTLLKDGTFLGALPVGTIIFDMSKNDEQMKLHKAIIAQVYKRKDFLGHQIILGNDGSIRYKVHFSDVHHIDADLKMDIDPLKYKPVVEKVVVEKKSQPIKVHHDITIGLGILKSDYTKEILNDDTIFAKTIQYNFATYGEFDLDFQPGIYIGLESNSGSSASSSYTENTLMVGPSTRIPILKSLDESAFAILSFKSSLLSRLTINIDNHNYSLVSSKQAIAAGLQFSTITESLGKVIFGLQIQRTWAKAKPKEAELFLEKKNTTDDALVFSVGFPKDWIW